MEGVKKEVEKQQQFQSANWLNLSKPSAQHSAVLLAQLGSLCTKAALLSSTAAAVPSSLSQRQRQLAMQIINHSVKIG